MRRLHELNGTTLGCWCKPNPCHGDVLVKLVQEHNQNNILSAVDKAGYVFLFDNDCEYLSRARAWAEHPIWLAHATRMSHFDLFYFVPHVFEALKRSTGISPDFRPVFEEGPRLLFCVG